MAAELDAGGKKLGVKRVVALVLASLIIAAGAFIAWCEHELGQPAAPIKGAVEFNVPKGASVRALGPLLHNAGLLDHPVLWRYFLFRHQVPAIKAGRHSVSGAMTVGQLAQALESAPIPEDVQFTVVEGMRLRDLDDALVAAGLISPGEYQREAMQSAQFRAPFPLPSGSLEGYLYPETYALVPGRIDVHALIQRQLDVFGARFAVPYASEIAASGRSLHQLVVMASILEREEPLPANRPVVAGILWKRFDRGIPLGVDATSRYELAQWNDRDAFLKRLQEKADAWNTRYRAGLPPGPIGAASVDSLVAALKPSSSEYLYYLHDAQHVLHPSRNAAEHEALRKQYHVY